MSQSPSEDWSEAEIEQILERLMDPSALRRLRDETEQLMALHPPSVRDPFADVAADVVVIARYGPGFSDDLSSWKLTLNVVGMLIQEISISNEANHYAREKRREVVDVGSDFVVSVLARAAELDFWNLNAVNPDMFATDCPSLQLCIRSGDQQRCYDPESVTWHAYHGWADSKKFMELWELIHQHAPFPERG